MTAETDRPDFKSPVELAREADFALGASRVSPSTREVLRGSEREILEPRVMQVLVALFQASGQVVSRDELIARCWEGRIVGEDAINRAIGRLRRLSGVDREASFVVETIPRVGYRLLAATAEAEPGSASGAVDPGDGAIAVSNVLPASRLPILGRHRNLATGLALLALAVSALATWLLWPEPHWTVESSRPFISTLALESEPAFSPDGKMLAYMSGPDVVSNRIYVRNLAGGDAILVTPDTHDAYFDNSPSWSSDGTHIAYSAQKPAEPCRIMIATVPAGETREVGRCRIADHSFIAWQPNSSYLYFADQRDDGGWGISRLDIDAGARRDIVNGGKFAAELQISPDGKLLAYQVYEISGICHFMVRDLTDGRERILAKTRVDPAVLSGLAWSTDSKTLLVSDSSGIGSKIVAYPVDGSMPYPIYASATGISFLSASVGGLLAFQSHINRKNLARASPTPIAQPDIIDPANGITATPTFAPDGTLAFVSNRSGTNAIWIMKPGAVPVPLYDAGSARPGRLSFSSDGARLVTVITSTDSATMKILTADGASVMSIDMPFLGAGSPMWTADGKGLIVWDSRIRRAVRVDVADPRRRTPVAPLDWQGVTIRSNGTFATREDKPGVWRIDRGAKLISSKYPRSWRPPITFLGDDVLIPDFAAAGGPRILAQPLSGGPDRVFAYAPGAEGFAFHSKMEVNPKTGEIIYVATVQSDTNIDLLTLARH